MCWLPTVHITWQAPHYDTCLGASIHRFITRWVPLYFAFCMDVYLNYLSPGYVGVRQIAVPRYLWDPAVTWLHNRGQLTEKQQRLEQFCTSYWCRSGLGSIVSWLLILWWTVIVAIGRPLYATAKDYLPKSCFFINMILSCNMWQLVKLLIVVEFCYSHVSMPVVWLFLFHLCLLELLSQC